MKIVVGLGNPGAEYETTRHNAGFLAVDRLIDRWKAQGPSKQFHAEVYKADFRGEKTLLVKPQTFMNKSGQSIGEICTFFKVAPADVVVLHDDLDLPSMALRIKTGGGNGGHNGLKSLDAHLGSVEYHRVRLGIGKPASAENTRTRETVDWVLEPYSQAELDQLDALLDNAAEAVELCIQNQVKEAMNRFNRRERQKDEEE
jgi:PTH1 family peptidyl-tRNA hydrolase